MNQHQHEEHLRTAKRAKVIATAEWVLAQAYRGCTRKEMCESQLRVREMRRRVRG